MRTSKRRKLLDWLRDLSFHKCEWLGIQELAQLRGFPHVKGSPLDNGMYLFASGICVDSLLCLRDEIRRGGWSYTQTSRTRHFFSKPYSRFDNPSLCGTAKLEFITSLEHDLGDDDKCKKCLRKFKGLHLKQVTR